VSTSSKGVVNVRYALPGLRPGWELTEETMPESVLHDEIVTLLRALLAAWAARAGNTLVVRNLAIRWDENNPRIGVDPDVAVVSPSPPDASDLRSIRTWLEGHEPPSLAIEVVSETNPHKDYALAPDKYAASATRELWIFDPLLAGPTSQGGPFRIQIWNRDSDGVFTRTYCGEGAAYSEALGAYAVAVDEGRKLRIAEDADATRFWLTAEEAERLEKQSERAQKDAERVQKEAALARVAELEALLKARG
jgi:hypothetical protein